jgi:diaminobutyrate-2-oxoglutarate transaminase
MEMVQGEGGVVVAERDFVRRVRAVTQELEIPLIVDEIQTGCGRTGTWFAFEQYGIEPDIVVVSKGLSGMGAPVSLMFYRQEMSWSPGMHIGTFRGNQLAFAAGLKTLEIFERDRVLDNVAVVGAEGQQALRAIAAEHAVVGTVRGLGLMLGLEMVDPDSGLPSGELAGRVQEAALAQGLIVETGGRHDSVVRMLPPLNISSGTMARAMAIIGTAVAGAERQWRQERPALVASSA